MTFENRRSAFVKLGLFLNEHLHSKQTDFTAVLARANQENAWFTETNIRFALKAVVEDLNEKNLTDWTTHYPALQQPLSSKVIAVIMAGNLPLVGFRDFLAVLLSGHKILCKLSSKDNILLRYLAEQLIAIEPDFSERICFEDSIIKGFDAVIATGGHHAVEHFYEYFSKYPHLIRGHRNSCAVLDGSETEEELGGLVEDMFRYFGLGCRNVTKLWVPENYDFQSLVNATHKQIDLFQSLEQHHLYQSNYQYQQVVSALNKQKIIPADVFTLIENTALTPPISVVYYEYYSELADVRRILQAQEKHLQCVVSHQDIPFGTAQKPTLSDYADCVDTMAFLLGL